jgi:hypothetical protein
MKMMKWSSILLLSIFFMWSFIPQVHAKHHCKNRTSFGLSFNVGVAPSYVAPTPIVAPVPVAIYRPYVAPIYPYYRAQVVAPVPTYRTRVVTPAPSVYVQPGFSYSYWRQ